MRAHALATSEALGHNSELSLHRRLEVLSLLVSVCERRNGCSQEPMSWWGCCCAGWTQPMRYESVLLLELIVVASVVAMFSEPSFHIST